MPESPHVRLIRASTRAAAYEDALETFRRVPAWQAVDMLGAQYREALKDAHAASRAIEQEQRAQKARRKR